MISYTDIVETICDNCQDAHSGDPSSVPNAGEVCDQARKQGWKIDGDHCLCEVCADVSRESRELDRADLEVAIQRDDLEAA